MLNGSRIVYRIATPPPNFEHFAYTHHGNGMLRLEWYAAEAGRSASGETFSIRHAAGRLRIQVPEDETTGITYCSQPIRLTGLHVFIDAGVLEVFANAGALCGTRRSYRVEDVVEIAVSCAGRYELAAWHLRPAW